jgi:hypothetical protein
MKEIESKIRLKLIDAIEKAMDDDEELTEKLDMWWCDSYAERMAEAALNVLMAMYDLDHWLKEVGELK